jgi:hypothetical protein
MLYPRMMRFPRAAAAFSSVTFRRACYTLLHYVTLALYSGDEYAALAALARAPSVLMRIHICRAAVFAAAGYSWVMRG